MTARVMHLVDTHFHADLQKDPAAVIADCESRGIYTIAVTNAPSVFDHTKALTVTTKYVRAALGLHPELVASHGHELSDLLRMMDQTRYVGEVGLDYVTTDMTLRKRQRRVFEAILTRSAELGDKILTVHSRRSAADVIACVGTNFPGTVILHWFSGNKRELRAALDAGCYFSVNPAMVRSERSRALIQEIPRERLLTETDGPFVEVRGRRAVPSDVRDAIEGIAALWGVETDEVAGTIFKSFSTIVESHRSAQSRT